VAHAPMSDGLRYAPVPLRATQGGGQLSPGASSDQCATRPFRRIGGALPDTPRR
jgi:hypothetical protein